MTEELPDKSAVRSTTVSIGRAQLAARVDISYKSVTGDADEMLVGMSHTPSRRGHDDHLDGTCICRTTFICSTTFPMSNHLGLSRLEIEAAPITRQHCSSFASSSVGHSFVTVCNTRW